MSKMRAMQVSKAKGPFELVEREIPEPGPGMVRIKVEACGVCHSDSLVKEGLMPIEYPRIPGHEAIGKIDKLGAGVDHLSVGQRVGIGWNGGYCGHCNHCRRGDFFACDNTSVTGLTHDGGYAEYMVARWSALAMMPDAMPSADAGPLVCAGVTTYNALRNSGAISGQVVAILGLGGLGHLGVQFANKMGFRTVGIARGSDKADFARQLGAHHYIDSQSQDVAAELQKLGGAKVILATVTNAKAMSDTLGGLDIGGRLITVGAPAEPLEVSALLLLGGNKSVNGWYSGTSIDSQDTLAFSQMTGVKSMNEYFPLERASEAYDRMMSGKARFRAVLKMGG